jgi:hypothetical protein
VVEAALRAARRVNDYSTAVRVFEGLREKVENEGQYKQYVEALADVRKELGECVLGVPCERRVGSSRQTASSISVWRPQDRSAGRRALPNAAASHRVLWALAPVRLLTYLKAPC